MLRYLVLGVFALSAWLATAQAQEPVAPLTLELTSSRELCTAGTPTEVSWEIAGGTPPYALTVGGETVDAGTSSARVSCGSAVDDAVGRLLGIGNERQITATVTDAAGTTVSAHAYLVLVEARRPPVDLQLQSTMESRGALRVLAQWRPGHGERSRSRFFLVRWRAQRTNAWTYDRVNFPFGSLGEREAEWMVDASQAAQVREYQLAELRDELESETPGALSWSASGLVTVAALPRDITAAVTHDSITLAWGPDVPGIPYTATVSHGFRRLTISGNGATPYTARFDGLLPDTWYTVAVSLGDAYWPPSPRLEFDVRTASAPDGWSRRVREPRNLEARVSRTGCK